MEFSGNYKLVAWGDTNIFDKYLSLKIPRITPFVFCSLSRQLGIKNGMFFGYAKQLCPNLQAVPYDFHAYKEVARTLYETLARYSVSNCHFVFVFLLLANSKDSSSFL